MNSSIRTNCMKFAYSLVPFFWLFTLPVMSQIPNSSFENWTSMGTYETPDQWGSLNHLTASSGVYTATKGTPGNPGNSYLQVTSRATSTGVVPGIVTCGVLDTTSMQPVSGFALAQRPQELTGNWQYMSFSGSPGSIKITLTRWDSINEQREIVASAIQSLPGMVMSWSYFSINIDYLTGNMPDTCLIVLEASGSVPSDNDYLWVDNLNFNGNVIGISDQSMQENDIIVSPNPSSDHFVIGFNQSPEEDVLIEMIDLSGRVVLCEVGCPGQSQVKISPEVEAGTYIIRISGINTTNTKVVQFVSQK